MSPLPELAAAAPVPVFPAVGEDAGLHVDELALDANVEIAVSPRHARILLVAGAQRDSDGEALARVHDQVPHPRATLCWGSDMPEFGTPARVEWNSDPRDELHALHRDLLTGERASEDDLLPDEPPNPWRGQGEFGQGGEGMMGGTPYGRMMPMPPQADLRDGLTLDAYTATIGPYYPLLHPGLVLEITWQGDVVQTARTLRAPLEPPSALDEPYQRALAEPVSIAALERARAAHHLGCVARLLDLLDLHRLARRCRDTARRARTAAPTDSAGLERAVRRAGAFVALPPGLGRRPEPVAREVGGPARRAAGEPVDARAHQAPYRDLAFAPITQHGGDVRARLRQWLAEARQSLQLAERARSSAPVPLTEAIESPWGALGPTGHREPAHADFDFTDLLVGREWHEAALILASFDAPALGRMMPWQPPPVPGLEGAAA